MGEVLLVALSLDGFHALELHQLREELLQQAGFVHQAEGHRRLPGDEHLVHLLHDAFGGKDLQAILHRPHRLQRFRDNGESVFGGGELRGEADGAEHAQRVVAVGLFRLERGADDAGREVADAPEGVHERAEILLAQAESHRIDGEIPPQLVLFQRPVLHDGLPGIAVVGLLARAHELHLDALVVQHRGAEVLEHAHVRMDLRRHGFRESDAAPLHDDVDVRVGTSQEAVADIAADDEGADPEVRRHVRHQPEDRCVQVSFRYRRHSISSQSGAFSTKTNPSAWRSNIKVFNPLVITT